MEVVIVAMEVVNRQQREANDIKEVGQWQWR